MTRERVGVAGLGRMGAAIATRLLEAGFGLHVYNRSAGRAADLVARGAVEAATPAELAAACDVVVTMVADDGALHDVVLGPGGVREGAHAGLVFMDMSTVSAAASAGVASALAEVGVPLLRAPVTGSTALAEKGALGALVSGPEECLRRWRHVLDPVAANVFYLGPGEEARVMKLVLNMLVASSMVGFAEALVAGERGGLDWQSMLDVFCASAVGSPLVEYKSAQLSGRDFAPAFTASMMIKDLDLALDAARRAGALTPMTGTARDVLRATAALGWSEHDFAAAVLALEKLSGA